MSKTGDHSGDGKDVPTSGHPVILSSCHPVIPRPVIGILGGIGSGKSSVARELAKFGGALIVADHFGHEALRQPALRDQVITRFGPGVVDEKGEIERPKVAAIVFNDAERLRALEAIVFPYIGRRIREEIEKARQRPEVQFIVLDAAVMLEAGWNDVCDKLVFVDAPREQRLRRVQSARGWTDADLRAREKLQMSIDEKRRRTDAVIDNSTTPEVLTKQVAELVCGWGLVKPTGS